MGLVVVSAAVFRIISPSNCHAELAPDAAPVRD
jgi:hypothetical protein